MKIRMQTDKAIEAIQDNFGPEQVVEIQIEDAEDKDNKEIQDALDTLLKHHVIAVRFGEKDGIVHFEPSEFKQRKVAFDYGEVGIFVTSDTETDYFNLLEKPEGAPF